MFELNKPYARKRKASFLLDVKNFTSEAFLRRMEMKLLNNTGNLERALDVSSLRHRLISNNIANVDTPGYKTSDVSFQNILEKEQARFIGKRTNQKHLIIGENVQEPKILVDQQTSLLNNDNNVDIEYEMTKLSENNLYYQTLTQTINKHYSMLRYVITEGRR